MIRSTQGNLLEADAEALVNTVNTVGYMGKGIALQFRQAFPANFEAYSIAAKAGEIAPGRMFVYETGSLSNPKYVINFPTKRHWRGKSRIEDIESGLEALVEEVTARGIRSLAVPPLGCGLGGLQWDTVQPLIERALGGLPGVDVQVFAPQGAPEAARMPIGTRRPQWTPARALFVALMDQYLELTYAVTLLEIQKLAYFLQEGGQNLKLRFEKGIYGPYAANLNKVLERMEGHFTRGYGDSQKPDQEIMLLPNASREAETFLARDAESRQRMSAVSSLIEGFETPYGMELLASTHWVAHHEREPARDRASAARAVRSWNARKNRIFSDEQVHVAWDRLQETGWLDEQMRIPEPNEP